MANNNPRRRGAVMIITLLAILLLVALILFVLNVGQQVNRRVAVQDTADAAAIAGATHVARTLNRVAAHNVAMSRYVALVSILDALPNATDYTRREQLSLRDALDAQLDRGVTSGSAALAGELRAILEDYVLELDNEIDQLENAHGVFEDYDISQVTHYNGPDGPGQLWLAMIAMDEMNQVALENLGQFTQRVATEGADAAIGEFGAGFLVPIAPRVPWERGQFNDLQRPVLNGLLPTQIDDAFERRGPYDTLFGWRAVATQRVGGRWVPDGSRPSGGGRGGVPIGSGAGGGGGGHWEGGEVQVVGYATWGMHNHLLRRVSSFVAGHLRNTRLSSWVHQMSRAKLSYLWQVTQNDDGEDVVTIPSDPEPSSIVDPQWVIDFGEAAQIGTNQPDSVVNTAFVAVEIKSRYPRGHAQFMSEGSWRLITDHGQQPRLVRLGGWVDPRGWEAAATVDKVVDYAWRDQWEYPVWFDLDIGIEPMVDEQTGQPVLQPVHRIDHFYFLGINVGQPQEIVNPFEGLDPFSSDAPAPSHLDHNRVNRTDTARREYLTYLAAARQRDHAQAWPSRFVGNKPYPNVVAIAQAKVFNNHSWDLWTQMWHAKLEPVSRYDDWLGRLAAGAAQAEPIEGVSAQDVAQIEQYLLSTSVLGEALLEH